MSKKDRRAYAQQREEERRAVIRKMLDEPMLELAGRLRNYTHSAELGSDPRSIALASLQKAIDDLAGVVTGDREYFHSRSSSIG